MATSVAFAGLPVQAMAQSTVTPARAVEVAIAPSIVSTFANYPDGGAELSAAVTDLLVGNPEIAPQFVAYMRSSEDLNDAQRSAAKRGFLDALRRLRAVSNPGGMPPWIFLVSAGVLGGAFAVSTNIDRNNPSHIPISPN
ncbi:hypothetical protein V6C03_07965 [Methyloligella sp. 2.7D]|uniref:hypothetical protein n=1 Tax=unclassified Methyloligella TaxID=2625955 RepID=UPI00157D0C2A|nr:hypothetical protein [Methyloligella sp. GL2]QKP78190.1 hypothetical protein HT051_12485 [Methyloligella sp. GL2]